MDKFVIKKIKELKKVEPDSSWLSKQKSFLLSEISQNQEIKRKPSLVLPLFNFNILKILKPSFAIALAVIVLLSSFGTFGLISASQNSLPGDFLYPVKTAFEQTQLTLTPGEVSKTKLSIKFANQRMDEFTQLLDKPDKPDKKENLEKTVQKFTAQMVSVEESIGKLKEKNAEKAAEVAELIKKQAPILEEILTKGADKLGYTIPSIGEAVEALEKASSSGQFEDLDLEDLEKELEEQ